MSTLTLRAAPRAEEFLAYKVWQDARGEGADVMTGVAWVLTRQGWDRTEFITPPDADFSLARAVAVDVVAGTRPDPTHDSNAYYPVYMMPPVWERRATFRVQIGNFRFYRLT